MAHWHLRHIYKGHSCSKNVCDGVSGLFAVSVFVWEIRYAAPFPATEEFSPEQTLAERNSQQHVTRKCAVKTRKQSDKEDHEPNKRQSDSENTKPEWWKEIIHKGINSYWMGKKTVLIYQINAASVWNNLRLWPDGNSDHHMRQKCIICHANEELRKIIYDHNHVFIWCYICSVSSLICLFEV